MPSAPITTPADVHDSLTLHTYCVPVSNTTMVNSKQSHINMCWGGRSSCNIGRRIGSMPPRCGWLTMGVTCTCMCVRGPSCNERGWVAFLPGQIVIIGRHTLYGEENLLHVPLVSMLMFPLLTCTCPLSRYTNEPYIVAKVPVPKSLFSIFITLPMHSLWEANCVHLA